MARLFLLFVLTLWRADSQKFDDVIPLNVNSSANNSNKDMYVIHAMVYQIGILTNSTDYKDLENETRTGAEEALTFYHTNGSQVDLSSIPQPLLTNITGENFVGVAPMSSGVGGNMTWSAREPGAVQSSSGTNHARQQRDTGDSEDNEDNKTSSEEDPNADSTETSQEPGHDAMSFPGFWLERALRKRDTEEETDTEKFLKVVNGNAVIPKGAGIQSVALPPLLSLNSNLSNIPVPIPNTSIVHYARVNTLITSSNDTS